MKWLNPAMHAMRAGGPVETVAHGETGVLCDPTPPAFAAALQQLLCQGEVQVRGVRLG